MGLRQWGPPGQEAAFLKLLLQEMSRRAQKGHVAEGWGSEEGIAWMEAKFYTSLEGIHLQS